MDRGKLAGLELLDRFPYGLARAGQVHGDAARFEHDVAVRPVVVADGRTNMLVGGEQAEPCAGRVDTWRTGGAHGLPLQGIGVHDGEIGRMPEARLDFDIQTWGSSRHKHSHGIRLDGAFGWPSVSQSSLVISPD
jgi:hypothetical protein